MKPKYPSFLPPDPKPPFEWLVRGLTRPLLRAGWDLREVEVSAADLARLRALRTERALIVSNHPSLAEPGVMYDVLKQAGLRCRLLSAWDTLFKLGWFSARFFQWLGGFSVRRGRPDRAAMEMTRDLLVGGERILAFPEGQTYGLNDTLLPFQEGLLLIAFHALNAMREQGIDAPVYVAPIAVKYVYLRPMATEIDAALGRLEVALGLKPLPQKRYERLRGIADAYLSRLETEEGLPPDEALSLDDRILRYRSTVVSRLGKLWEARMPRGADFPDQVLVLGNAFEDYGERQVGGERKVAEVEDADHRTWRRLKTFLALRDGYVAEWPSAERYADILTRLELDLFGRTHLKGPRKAVIRVGEVLDLTIHLENYAANRRETLATVTRLVEEQVRNQLEPLWRATQPLAEPVGVPE